MTVGELIEILDEWNPDDEVAIMVDHYMYSPSYEEDYKAVTFRLDCQIGGVGELIGSEQSENETITT